MITTEFKLKQIIVEELHERIVRDEIRVVIKEMQPWAYLKKQAIAHRKNR